MHSEGTWGMACVVHIILSCHPLLFNNFISLRFSELYNNNPYLFWFYQLYIRNKSLSFNILSMTSVAGSNYGSVLSYKKATLHNPSSSIRNGGNAFYKLNFLPKQGASRVRQRLKVLAMATKKKVNAYDENWTKQWFGAGIFQEGSEDVDGDIVKKLEKKKLLSQVEKQGLLTKAEGFGLTLSSIEKMGLLSKAEDLGLLSLVEKATSISPAALASLSLPFLLSAIAIIVLFPDDSLSLVITQNILASIFALGSVGLFGFSIVLSGLQD